MTNRSLTYVVDFVDGEQFFGQRESRWRATVGAGKKAPTIASLIQSCFNPIRTRNTYEDGADALDQSNREGSLAEPLFWVVIFDAPVSPEIP